MILKVKQIEIGPEKSLWEDPNFISLIYIGFFIFFVITLLFIIDSFRNKSVKRRKTKRLLSISSITISYFILLIAFLIFLSLLCSEGLCEFVEKKIHVLLTLLTVIIANFGMILRKSKYFGMIKRESTGKRIYILNYVFACYNLIISIYIIKIILSSCFFKV